MSVIASFVINADLEAFQQNFQNLHVVGFCLINFGVAARIVKNFPPFLSS